VCVCVYIYIYIISLKKAMSMLIWWEKNNQRFEMDMLIVECVESKFLNFEFFWKDIKIDEKKIINDFEMDMLIVECVESKFLNFEFFWKDIKNDANASKIYLFLSFLLFLSMDVFGKNEKRRSKLGYDNSFIYIYIYIVRDMFNVCKYMMQCFWRGDQKF
jgi:hypothetical protein